MILSIYLTRNILNPRAFVPKLIPLDIHEGTSAEIVLSQYVVNRNEDLPLRVRIQSNSAESLNPRAISVYLSGDDERENM